METPSARTVTWTALALIAFAANSLLCRRALGHTPMDAVSFSTIRLTAGAATLVLVARSTRSPGAGLGGSWFGAALLFLYAVPFSLAYVELGAASGALILFGAVQATMLAAALSSGERPHPVQWAGLLLALGGLVFLVMPGLTAPSPAGCALMILSGFSWGVYSIQGRGTPDAVADNAGNFLRALPLAAGASVLMHAHAAWSAEGALLAVISGALTSGLGYVAWYAALTGLTATSAASVQLAVPVIAAAGGVALLGETLTARLVLSAIAILGGVGLALTRTARRRPPPRPAEGRPPAGPERHTESSSTDPRRP